MKIFWVIVMFVLMWIWPIVLIIRQRRMKKRPKEISVKVGEKFEIELKSKSPADYFWQEHHDECFLKLIETKHIVPPLDKIGGPSKTIYKFKTLCRGKTKILFKEIARGQSDVFNKKIFQIEII